MKKAKHKCSICGGPFSELEKQYWLGGGHNAQPINDGRCCSTCNAEVVLPARIERFNRGDNMREVRPNDTTH